MQPLNYNGQESNKQSAVYEYNTPVTLKQVDSQLGYNHAKFKKPHFNSVHKKANLKFLSNQKTCQ